MSGDATYGKQIYDANWGCNYSEINFTPQDETIKVCYVKVSDIKMIASELTRQVQDTSWMMNLDSRTKRAYNTTVNETAQILVDIFRRANGAGGIAGEFGESMVSMGSASALEKLFNHYVVPVAELWKPQVKQNEGFDFHTVCTEEMINFGEAKFSSVKGKNPHYDAIPQACDFIDENKHLRDSLHLEKLVSDNAMNNLDNDDFGVIAAFSINSDNPVSILKNALESAQKECPSRNIKSVYLVGVQY